MVTFVLFNPSDRGVIIVNVWFVTVWMYVCVYVSIPLGEDLTVYDGGRRTENEKMRQDQLNVEI